MHPVTLRSALAAVSFAVVACLAMTAAPAAGDAQFSGEAYPLETCPVSGEKLGKDATVVVLEGMKDKKLDGTQVRFCCAKCAASFKAEPEKYVGKMNEAIAKAAPAYPIKTCLVMKDEELESDAKTIVWQNRVYKPTTCPISGKPLGEGAVDVVVNGQLVRTCCGGCVAAVKADPKAAIAKASAPAKAADPKM